MGTSSRKVNDKIKKILKDSLDSNEYEFEKMIPKLSNEVMKLKKTRKYFGDKDFMNIMAGGVIGIGAIKKGTFQDDYGIEFNESIQNSILKREEILQAILDKVESDIQSNFLLKSYKTAMTEVLLSEGISVFDFVFNFIVCIIYYNLMEEINEAVIETLPKEDLREVEKITKKHAKLIVDEKLKHIILEFAEDKIDINKLIEFAIKEVENLQGSEF